MYYFLSHSTFVSSFTSTLGKPTSETKRINLTHDSNVEIATGYYGILSVKSQINRQELGWYGSWDDNNRPGSFEYDIAQDVDEVDLENLTNL